MNADILIGLAIGGVIGLLFGVYYKQAFVLALSSVIYSIILGFIAAVIYAAYFHTDTVLFVLSIVVIVLLTFGALSLLEKITYLNLEESGAIVVGFVINIVFIASAFDLFDLQGNKNRLIIFILVISSIQVYAYIRARKRHIKKLHNKSLNADV